MHAKHKIERRYGVSIWGQESSPVTVRSYPPGQHGPKSRKRETEYGQQLAAKQKLKGFYGDIVEKQFLRLYKEAENKRGHTGKNLISYLERRLDSFVYRVKWSPTPFMARQIVNHGHILVNGKRVNIRSYRLCVGDVVSLSETMKKNATVMLSTESSERDVPGYIDVTAFEAKLLRFPDVQEVPYPFQVNVQSVIEYYSR